jgi:polyketide biosynthesis enoyl-CoA hydratase PksI
VARAAGGGFDLMRTGDVVGLTREDDGVVVLSMEEREHKNTFSTRLLEGLTSAFAEIARDEAAKVVVVHGYDTYFCCGGTQEELIELCDGRRTFADQGFYRLLLDCELPTISAMQGHGIGGGLAFGILADTMVLSEESLYSCSMMKYGFTPGMGLTYTLPLKFGDVLGNEMLFSARSYRGSELRERGVSALVAKRKDVVSLALALARDLASKPTLSLKLLKKCLASKVRAALPATIDEELAMHNMTFAQPEVRERIRTVFGK